MHHIKNLTERSYVPFNRAGKTQKNVHGGQLLLPNQINLSKTTINISPNGETLEALQVK